mmetsp:Transcript_17599/g.56906  ORF Transcript_17599/g.56906 Transcript_17599/m.56906 type:complete len:178 (-) Transcript_17599:263-796(-)
MVAPAYPLAAVVGLVLHRRPRRAPGVISIDGTLVTRLLQEGDRSKGFLELLGQLTTVGEISEGDWKRRVKQVTQNPAYAVVVIEDVVQKKVVGTAQLIIEDKFIHECGRVGHVEDVVVDASVRGRNLGRKVVEAVTAIAKQKGCYKCILDCAEDNAGFYGKLGYKRKEVQMVQYFDR